MYSLQQVARAHTTLDSFKEALLKAMVDVANATLDAVQVAYQGSKGIDHVERVRQELLQTASAAANDTTTGSEDDMELEALLEEAFNDAAE